MNKTIPLHFGTTADSDCERADAVANRQKILTAAAKLFAERTVTDVTMKDIAQVAEVGKGTLYRRFANKGALCLALLDSEFKRYQDEQLKRMQEGMEKEETNLYLLTQFMHHLILFIERYNPLLEETSRERTADLGLPHFWQFMTIRSLLQRAIITGELNNDFDYNYWADLLLAPLSTGQYYFQRHIRNYSVQRMIDRSVQLIILFPSLKQ